MTTSKINNAIYLNEIIEFDTVKEALETAYAKGIKSIFVDGHIVNLPEPQRTGTMTQRASYIKDKINTFVKFGTFFPHLENRPNRIDILS